MKNRWARRRLRRRWLRGYRKNPLPTLLPPDPPRVAQPEVAPHFHEFRTLQADYFYRDGLGAFCPICNEGIAILGGEVHGLRLDMAADGAEFIISFVTSYEGSTA